MDRVGYVDVDASPAVDGDDGIEHLSHHAGKSATSWLAIVLVILCGAGAWVRSNRWQRAKRERPDLEDPLSTQPLTSQSRRGGSRAAGIASSSSGS